MNVRRALVLMKGTRVAAAIDGARVVERVRADREFHAYATGWNGAVEFGVGNDSWVAALTDGRLEAFTRGQNPDADIKLTASEHVWEQLWAAQPGPGFTGLDVAATQGLRIEGDPVTSLGPYFPALQRLARLLGNEAGADQQTVSLSQRDASTVRARYVYITVDGVEYRVFVQEAGHGIPVVLQHSGGADSRQWRHVLADTHLQSQFRLIAIDLPFHGKSLPPRLDRWWKREYQVTGSDLTKRLLATVAALGVDQPVYVGWGKLGLELATHHGDKFRAIVALNAMLHHDAVRVYDSALFHHPQISESFFGSLEYGKTSSHGPEASRREIHWIVASNGLGVYKGDYEYDTADEELRHSISSIDTSTTPLWLLAGEFDPASLVADGGTAALAALIPDGRYRLLEGVGSVGDNPVEFGRHLREVLEEIAAESRTTDV